MGKRLVAVCLLVVCAPGAPVNGQDKNTQPANVEDPTTRVTILDRGSPADKSLVFEMKKEMSARYRIDSDVQSELTVDGAKRRGNSGKSHYLLTITIKPGTTDGIGELHVRIDECSTNEIVGAADTARIYCSRGMPTAPFQDPKGDFATRTYIRRSGMFLKDFSIPVPWEKLGSGARWTAVSQYQDLRGNNVTRTLTCKLESVTDSEFSVSATIEELAGPQAMKKSEGNDNLLEMRLSGTLDATLRTSDWLPTNARIKSSGKYQIERTTADGKIKIDGFAENKHELKRIESEK